MPTCKNCGNHFEGNYCNDCGQSAHTHKLSMHYIWHDLQHGMLHFDNGIFYTIRQLLTRPGHTIREFIEGKRVKHFKPFSFVVVLATLYGFFYHYTISHTFESHAISPQENLANAYLLLMKWNLDHFAIFNLLLIAITTISSYFVFRKQGYDFAEHLVLNTYLTGLVLLVTIIGIPYLYYNKGSESLKWFAIIVQVVDFSLMYWCYSQFFQRLSKVKSFALTLLCFLITSMFTLLLGYFVGWIVTVLK